MALELLVFDCDGVLLESMDLKGQAFYRLGLRFGQEAADRLLMYHYTRRGISRFEKFDWLYRTYADRALTAEEGKALNSEFVALVHEEMAHCALVPGALEVLEAWQGRVPLYVASGAPQEDLRLILDRRGLARFFNGIYGSPASKTHILRAVLQETGIVPGNGLMIGDGRVDQSAAEAVGLRFYGRGERFRQSGCPWGPDLTGLNAWLQDEVA